MTAEQFLFLMAIDEFKKANSRTFPQWTDVLEVIHLLGYRKTMPSELNLRRAEDWRERADAAAGVRDRVTHGSMTWGRVTGAGPRAGRITASRLRAP